MRVFLSTLVKDSCFVSESLIRTLQPLWVWSFGTNYVEREDYLDHRPKLAVGKIPRKVFLQPKLNIPKYQVLFKLILPHAWTAILYTL